MVRERRVLFVVGPTASGKSSFAYKIARRLNAEIISADSMQIYKRMDIGTDKPTAAMRRTVKHHLLDIVSPDREFSVYEYRSRAMAKIDDVLRRGKLPVVAGGTGLYIKALVDGISPHPGKDENVREELRREAAESGVEALHARLTREDPAVAARVHPHDEKRIVRALEVLAISGKSLAAWEKETVSLEQLGYRHWIVGLRGQREELYDKINRRVDRMFRNGLVNEARRLARGRLSLTASQAVGYRELLDHFAGRMTLAEARDKIKQHTRNLAKRQIIWFKKDARIRWFDKPDRAALEEVIRMVKHG